MPDFLRDWNLWWLDFWSAHPALFWLAAAIAIAIGLCDIKLRR